ncbi:MAG TPA: DMT family transporter [Gammaproteobacteria bacterium]|nr:DMT family transporter [Gammaproteobacteria bacterium]
MHSSGADSDSATQRTAGVVMVLLGGTCLSTAGVLLRYVESANGWQILFYRGLFFFLTMILFLIVRYRGRFLSVLHETGRAGIFLGVTLGFASVLYIFGILSTTVANVVFIISAAPLITALLARFILGERPSAGTWAAMLAALCGVGLMVGDGLAGGGLFGVLCALGVALSFAALLITLRLRKGIDMLPALCIGGLVSSAIALTMTTDLSISLHDMAICFTLGTVQFGGGFILITLGARYLLAAETALLSLTETVLAPIWVWLAINETPSMLTLAGGAVVVTAVASRAAHRANRRAPVSSA